MRFNATVNHQQQFATIKLIDTQHFCEAEIFCFGGILNSFSILKNNQSFNIIDAYTNVDDAIAQKNTWFKSCNLSPFVCRLKNGTYHFNNQKYTIEKFYLNENAMHGLVYDAVYNIVKTETTNDFALVALQTTYNATDAGYPFTYTINLVYKLEANNKLTITSTIQHNNAISIPYCQGWHHYFKLDAPIDNCSLQFDATAMFEFDESLIPTGNIVKDSRFIKGSILKNIDIDNCYLLDKNKIAKIVFQSNHLKLIITPKLFYGCLQIFIPNHRQNIAIESLSAAPNAFNNNIELSILQPNKNYVFEVQYEVMEMLNKAHFIN
jgi:aldose 1-epimerase